MEPVESKTPVAFPHRRKPGLIVALVLLVLVALAAVYYFSSHTRITQGTYSFVAPRGTKATAVTGGHQYTHETSSITVKTIADGPINGPDLFTEPIKKQIRLDYQEAYKVEGADIKFSNATIRGHQTLRVQFEDNSAKKDAPTTHYYLVQDKTVYVISYLDFAADSALASGLIGSLDLTR